MTQGLLPLSTEHPHSKYQSNSKSTFSRWLCSIVNRYQRSTIMRLRMRSVSILFLCVCAVLYLVFFYLINDNVVLDEQFVHAVPDVVLEKRLDFQSMTIDKMCSQLTTRCYSVVDKKAVAMDENVERHLIVHGFEDESDTVINLIAPKGETFDTSDTRIWAIDHSHFNTQYVAGMLLAPYLVGTFPIKSTGEGKHMTVIGLGGGSLDMALRGHLPKLNITTLELDPVVITLAEKWFGVTRSADHLLIAGDGLVYVEQMVARNETTDVLVLDACDTSLESPCPAAVFRKPEIVNKMKMALAPQGSLVVNILSHNDANDKPTVSAIVSVFTDIFPSCLLLEMPNEINIVLVCVPYSIGDSKEQLKFYNSRLQSIVSTFSLEYILKGVTVSNKVTTL